MNREEILIVQDSANNILEDSNKYEQVETRGLLFGKTIDKYIIILKVVTCQMPLEHKFILKWTKILR